MQLLVVAIIAAVFAPSAHAVVCQNKKSGGLKVRDGECRRKEIAFTGLVGPPGADGQLRVYGDGSAGTRTFTSGDPKDTNLQYTDCTVPAGVVISFPSGTVIRCTGTFTNNGTVVATSGAQGGVCAQYNAPNTASYRPPSLGVALAAPLSAERGTATQVQGGQPGVPLNAGNARALLRPGPGAGGGGSCGADAGGPGGGGLTILAAAAIVNNGTIEVSPLAATGLGGGGGAGGVLILASRGTITNSGALRAEGGPGGSAHDYGTIGAAAGGGGGGGIVHLLAPTITAGLVSVAGGPPGAAAVGSFPGASTRVGGGGGGACGGAGGYGGNVIGTTPGAGSPGEAGLFLQSVLDPTSLL
jgi:hypothetical protein